MDYRCFLPPRRMELHLKTAGRNRYIGLNVEETEDFEAYQSLTFFLSICALSTIRRLSFVISLRTLWNVFILKAAGRQRIKSDNIVHNSVVGLTVLAMT